MIRFATLALVSLLSNQAQAFLLVDPKYHLANPEKTEVNISSGSCAGNQLSNDDLASAINEVIEKYWNTVTESRLKIKYGGEVSTPISGTAESGKILVGCQALGASGASGVTYPSTANGSAVIVLNASVFVPGGYYRAGLIGVLAHEMGHAMGLNHSGDPASVMTYESHAWGPAATHLAQDDKDGIVYLYPNPEFALGLLGSCSAIASTGRKPAPANAWAYVLEFLLLLFSGYLARASIVAAGLLVKPHSAKNRLARFGGAQNKTGASHRKS